ncbi:MAG: hypothetical protein ACRYGR_04260 [Janthinobacterium lividum]
MNKKIVVVGTSGSGKSTLARVLSIKFNIPHIEMDHLYWGENWSINANFRELLEQQLQIPGWIVCGNYSKVKDLTWRHATIIIWLDYPFYLVFWRALKRSVMRIYTGEKICGGNRETLKRFFSKNSILWWVIQTYHRRKSDYQSLMLQENKTLMIIRITSPKELDEKISIIDDF